MDKDKAKASKAASRRTAAVVATKTVRRAPVVCPMAACPPGRCRRTAMTAA
jgi:hypothetical protein